MPVQLHASNAKAWVSFPALSSHFHWILHQGFGEKAKISAGNLINKRSFNTGLYVKMQLFLFYFSLVLELCSLLYSHLTFFE